MLLFSDNIAIYPEWSEVDGYTPINFTLMFENLPKECTDGNAREALYTTISV